MTEIPVEKMDLPPDAIVMLREMKLSDEEIEKVKEQHGGTGEYSFTPEEAYRAWKEYCDIQTGFLKEGYKNDLAHENSSYRALAKLVEHNPERSRIAENFQELKEGRKAVEYFYSDYIKNMGDFAYYTVDVRETLGVKIIPSHRYDHEKDEYKRPNCFRLADLATAIKQQEINQENARKAITLAKKVYNLSLTIAPNKNDLSELKKILRAVPKYNVNAMVWHENVDGHTLNLVASGKLHTGSDTGGLSHKGGHTLIRAAEEIIKSRNKTVLQEV